MPTPSRRDLLCGTLAAAAAPLGALAQTPPGANPIEDARKNVADAAQAIRAVPLTQFVEPAFEFKV